MSNVISNQNKLTALEFQFEALKKKLKNEGILFENNKESKLRVRYFYGKMTELGQWW